MIQELCQVLIVKPQLQLIKHITMKLSNILSKKGTDLQSIPHVSEGSKLTKLNNIKFRNKSLYGYTVKEQGDSCSKSQHCGE